LRFKIGTPTLETDLYVDFPKLSNKKGETSSLKSD